VRVQVLQFGYVSMFSVAFPLGAMFAALTNALELKLDAYKFTFATRRPSYEGADGIGNWKAVMRAYSALALFVNVLVVAYATNSVRDYLIIPLVAEESACELVPLELGSGVGTSQLVSDAARHLGLRTSWVSSCPENFRNCFVDIGAVPWLPASLYLHPNELSSRPYLKEGLCLNSSALYEPAHCELCRHRIAQVYLYLSWFVLVVEHMLIALKLIVMAIVPDKPAWVRKNEARAIFVKDRMSEEA